MRRTPRNSRNPSKVPRSKKGRTQKQTAKILRRGTIFVVSPHSLNFPTGRIKARPGAELTIRQIVPGLSFSTHSGVGGSSYMGIPVATGASFAFAFALSDLPQDASWKAVFDQYRFENVRIHMFPISNIVDVTNVSGPNNSTPPCVVVLDYDDAGSLASQNAALEYDNAQLLQPYSGCIIDVKPKTAPAYFQGGVFGGYGVQESGEWLDAASDTIEHYGVKGWLNPLAVSSTETMGWYIYGSYEVSFTNTR